MLAKVIDVDEHKCLNCHRCISVCPVKYCNDGSGEIIKINHDMCIGCGECLTACTHGARTIVDDFESAISALINDEKMIAISAPATIASFPEQYLNLNGWLQSMGVDAVFDVSFGAELTVKSYIEYMKSENPKMIIAQPCPAIVTYIELYRPELIQYLAPCDSPMNHTLKMIREFYPQYSKHKILTISPCIAKKREFEETNIGDYNVTVSKILDTLTDNEIDLNDYPAVEYANDPAERAALFSSPGGLLETASREIPEIRERTRKIEGATSVYQYLDELSKIVDDGTNPLLIDCLSCDKGCNGGTGTKNQHASIDLLESRITKRKNELQKLHGTKNDDPESIEALRTIINKYWKKGLYDRTYNDLSGIVKENIKIPSDAEVEKIFESMKKFTTLDIKNCSSCGYNTCKSMAKAIYNNLNRPENCHFFMGKVIQEYGEHLEDQVRERTKLLNKANDELKDLNATKDKFFSIIAHDLKNPLGSFRDVSKLLVESYHDFEESEKIEFLNLMMDSSRNIYMLLENLLDWSQTQKGVIKFNPIDCNLKFIADTAIQLLQLTADNKNISLVNNIESSIFVKADYNLILTVIRNLISNSIKFTPKGGTICLNTLVEDGSILFSVKDSGIGMSQKTIEKLFRIDINVTTLGTSEEKGTGLGLILCKEFIEKHQGKIWAESELEKGSTFYFKLPKEQLEAENNS